VNDHKEHKEILRKNIICFLKALPFLDADKHLGKVIKAKCHFLFQEIVSTNFSLVSLCSLWPMFSLKCCNPQDHIELGMWGERIAAKELRRRGFKILYHNYRGPHGGEIDLVCRDREILVFTEVKTRSREDYSRPFDAVDRKKRKLIQRGALAWLRLLGFPTLTFRFDVVEVIAGKPPEVRVIENAFPMPEWFKY